MASVLTYAQSRVILRVNQTDNTSAVSSRTGIVDAANGSAKVWTINTNTINSVNQVYAPAAITLTGNSTTTVDLSNSTSTKTPTNAAIAFARIKGVYIAVSPTTATVNGTLVNGVFLNSSFANSALNAGMTIPPGGEFFWRNPTANGNTIDSTHKNIRLENLDVTNTASVTLVVLGSDA